MQKDFKDLMDLYLPEENINTITKFTDEEVGVLQNYTHQIFHNTVYLSTGIGDWMIEKTGGNYKLLHKNHKKIKRKNHWEIQPGFHRHNSHKTLQSAIDEIHSHDRYKEKRRIRR